MTQMAGAVSERTRRFDLTLKGGWPLALGFAVLAVPTFLALADEVWNREFGAHGPIVLATGAWLLWRQTEEFRKEGVRGNPAVTALLFLPSIAVYVFGRAYDFISLETAGLYGVGLAILHSLVGLRSILRNWFPFFYLAFAIPPPQWLIDDITAPLKHFVSYAATGPLEAVGIPLAREGVTIFVAQYQLLVEDACSGVNSLIGLMAISLLYIYLMHRTSVAYAALLALLVVPIAVLANILRIIVLILLTYFFGDGVAQGFSHDLAGLFLFATALLLVFALDKAIHAGWRRIKRGEA
jgi:exosortase